MSVRASWNEMSSTYNRGKVPLNKRQSVLKAVKVLTIQENGFTLSYFNIYLTLTGHFEVHIRQYLRFISFKREYIQWVQCVTKHTIQNWKKANNFQQRCAEEHLLMHNSGSSWATAADQTRCFFCHLRTGKWSYNWQVLSEIGLYKIAKYCLIEWVLMSALTYGVRFTIWHWQHEIMDPSHPVSTVWAAACVMVWGFQASHVCMCVSVWKWLLSKLLYTSDNTPLAPVISNRFLEHGSAFTVLKQPPVPEIGTVSCMCSQQNCSWIYLPQI